MTIDLEFTASIHKVAVSVREKDGVVSRVCKLQLAREFDHMIADALGADAKRVVEALAARGLKEAVIPMDALVFSGRLKTLEAMAVELPFMRGIKARAKAGAKEEEPSSVRLDFEFDFSDDAWIFLGRNVSSYAQVTLSRLQQEFAFTVANDASAGRKSQA